MSNKIQPSEPANHIAVFQETAIRRAWHNEGLWFVIVDVGGRSHRFDSSRGGMSRIYDVMTKS